MIAHPCFLVGIFIVTASACSLGCRTVTPVRNIQAASAPDVSRLLLRNGSVVQFNKDFGWYNAQEGTVEGVTRDSQQAVYHLSEIQSVETVRSYELGIAVVTALAPLAVGIYLLAKVLSFLP
ncbi:MAG TPA: hypothetical protein VG537_10715 [Candidatus Kapabacteria bacterium]|jgi:hypothetical protein|nr:hypothetical protein [Candidatus Kapabacteria bacterium]